MDDNKDIQTDLYEAIDDLVRHHDRREPFITNIVKRIYWLVRDGLPQEKVRNPNDYRKGYAAGYAAGKRAVQQNIK